MIPIRAWRASILVFSGENGLTAVVQVLMRSISNIRIDAYGYRSCAYIHCKFHTKVELLASS